MENKENSNSDINRTLQQLLSEIQGQKEEINSLKEAVSGNSVSVAAEVKKLRSEKDLSWRFEGNKIQYTFNAETEENIKQALWGIQHGKFDYVKETLNACLDKLKQRNKLIRIADTSEGGWDTVKQYETNPIASDSEDESKIFKAENRALKKKKERKTAKRKHASSSVPAPTLTSAIGVSPFPWNGPVYGAAGSGTFLQDASARNRLFRGPQGPSFPRFGSGTCFACGEFGHFRRTCPRVNAFQPSQPSEKKRDVPTRGYPEAIARQLYE